MLYSADPPYNCFPSLHVAHSFVSALACIRVHRKLGVVATNCAALVALSTLFTKQHYILDVIAGILLALAAYVVFLRSAPGEETSTADREVAPLLGACIAALILAGLGGFWLVYLAGGESHFEFGP